MKLLLLLVSLMVLVVPSLPAQAPSDEAKQLLTDWDNFEVELRGIQRKLADKQAEYNGSVGQKRDAIRQEFGALRNMAIEKAKSFVARIDAFLMKNPKNIEVRKRRLEDRVFARLSPAIKARDAEILFEQTKDGRYVQEAAELWSKGYRFARSAKAWKMAVDRAATFQTLKKWGEASLQIDAFKDAATAFQRMAELAKTDNERQEAQRYNQIAAQYVAAWPNEKKAREDSTTKKNNPIVEIDTARGKLVCELFEDEAPNTVANFIALAEKGFYDGLDFHRCQAYFMVQGGDPDGTGAGGPGYNIRDEINLPKSRLHYRGSLSMANTGRPNSGGSQFFVCNAIPHWLNGKHTVFGRVIGGIEAAEVPPLDPTNKAAPFKMKSVKVIRKRDHPYEPETIQG